MGKRTPASVPLIVPIDPTSHVTLFAQIYESIREAILGGRLRPGMQVPSSRLLAAELGVSRSTIVLAYQHLAAEGYLTGAPGAGSFVSRDLPDVRPRVPSARLRAPEVRTGPRPTARRARDYGSAVLGSPQVARAPVPFRVGEPAADAFPLKLWAQLYQRRARGVSHALLRYGSPLGYKPLREAIVTHLGAARGVKASIEQVVLVRGTQQALDVAARSLLDPGDEVWVEDPGYLAARAVFEAAGARIVPVPVDEEGMIVSTGETTAPRARVAATAPSHQYPLGVTMSLPRRLALLEWASRAGAWIIEDDYDSECRYRGRPLMALQGLDQDRRVIYVGSFSKTLFPALRLGYLVLPPDLVDTFTAAHAVADYLSPTIEQAVVADFLAEGHYARHLRRMRALYRSRRDALLAALEREVGDMLQVASSEAGIHIVAWLPAGTDDVLVSRAAFEAGLEAPPLSIYRVTSPRRPGLVLGYAACDEPSLASGVRTLAAVLTRIHRRRR